jgi:hypothetical protein
VSANLTNPRWAAELIGNEFDLSGACDVFENSENVRVKKFQLVTGRAATMLMAMEFESCSSAMEVNNSTGPTVDFLNGILFVTDQAREPVRTNAIYERQSDGNWGNGIGFGSVRFAASARMRARAFVAPGTVSPQEKWMNGAMSDQIANDVLTYLRGEPDWFELYKAHETIGAAKGKFTQTAQAARHSEEWCRQNGIRKYMTIEEAREHVRSLVRDWLNSRFP